MRFDITEMRICTDCAMLTANGELGQGDDTADAAHAARMVATLGADARHLVIDCRHDDDDDDDGIDRSHDDFSRVPCGACDSSLAGARCHAALLIPVRA